MNEQMGKVFITLEKSKFNPVNTGFADLKGSDELEGLLEWVQGCVDYSPLGLGEFTHRVIDFTTIMLPLSIQNQRLQRMNPFVMATVWPLINKYLDCKYNTLADIQRKTLELQLYDVMQRLSVGDDLYEVMTMPFANLEELRNPDDLLPQNIVKQVICLANALVATRHEAISNIKTIIDTLERLDSTKKTGLFDFKIKAVLVNKLTTAGYNLNYIEATNRKNLKLLESTLDDLKKHLNREEKIGPCYTKEDCQTEIGDK